MGCGGSTLESDSPTGLVLHKRDKITIHLHVGNEVKILAAKPQVILVFGECHVVTYIQGLSVNFLPWVILRN